MLSSEELKSLSHQERHVISLAAASCLKKYNQQLSAAHYRIGLLLLNGGAKSLIIDRCSQLGFSVCQHSAVRMQTKVGETFTKFLSWKEDMTRKELHIRFLEEILKSTESDEAPLNISKDNFSNLGYFQEETYDSLIEFVHGVKQRRNGGRRLSAVLTRKDLKDAVEELKSSIVHYKYE